MPPHASVDAYRRRRSALGGVIVSVVAAAFLLSGCGQSRPLTITSECDTDVLVDWLYRSQGGTDVVQDDQHIEAGEHEYADAVETEYIALLNNGEVLAETSLPADQLDADGVNRFPSMVIPAEVCDQLTPAAASDDASDGY